MKRINCMVSNDAKKVLVTWKTTDGFTTLDETLENLLLEFNRMKTEIAKRKEAINHIDELIEDDA